MGEGMKILFLVYHILSPHSGISKKIMSEVDALRENGAEVSLCTLTINPDGSKSRVVDGKEIRSFGHGLAAKLRKRVSYSDIVTYINNNGIELVYVRYDINSDPFTFRMARQIKKSGVKLIVEIPTYPYDGEFKGQGFRMNLQLVIDKMFRKRFFSQCDRLVVYTDDETVFSRPTIRISNGVDFNNIPLSSEQPFQGKLQMLSVANVHLWHGLDRLIRGMAESKDKNSELHIVGDGLESIFREYRNLTAQNSLEGRVKILGPMYGEELDREFEWCNLAVGSLARHRSGINNIKTLKNREYAARGKAFFFSEDDSDFNNAPYVCKVAACENPIDIIELEKFRSNMSMSPKEIRDSIKGLSWTAQMGKVLKSV